MVVSVCTIGSVLPAVNDGAVVGLLLPLIKLGTKSEGVAEVEDEEDEVVVVVVLLWWVAAAAALEVVGDNRGGVAVPGAGSFLMNASSAGNRARMVLRSMACGELEEDALALADFASDCI